MEVNPQIFRAYDIRGVYGEDFDGEFVQEIGAKLGTHFQKLLIIGRDGRQSSPEIQKLLELVAQKAGAHIIDIGQCTTPLFYFSVRQSRAVGGIMVTASHNPGDYNGFKVVGAGAEIIGGQDIKNMLEQSAASGQGTIKSASFLND